MPNASSHQDHIHPLKSIDLQFSEDAIERLERLSAETGRSISDLAADLLSLACADLEQQGGGMGVEDDFGG